MTGRLCCKSLEKEAASRLGICPPRLAHQHTCWNRADLVAIKIAFPYGVCLSLPYPRLLVHIFVSRFRL